MKTTWIWPAIAVSLLATSASAQNFRLDLTLTYRSLSSQQEVVTDVRSGGTVALRPGVHRIELRYRIADLTADNIVSRGLSSALINISASGPGVAGAAFERAPLTNAQWLSNIITNPDSSSFDPTFSGLVGSFRGGLMADTDPGNGGPTLAFPTLSVVPLTLTAPNHNSWSQFPNTCLSCSDVRWGVFTFNLRYAGRGPLTLTASALADPQTGNRFGYFARVGTVNDPVPRTSTLANDGIITIVPGCVGDYNTTGGITVGDVFDFLSDWFATNARADVNLDGAVNAQDVFDFLTAWFSRCE